MIDSHLISAFITLTVQREGVPALNILCDERS